MLIKTLSLIVLSFISAGTISASVNNNVFSTSLSGTTDTFDFFEENYQSGQGFVYTADVCFNEGQAAGLVFGAIDEASAYVFNVDRYENKVKLLHFTKEDSWKANELYAAPYIGNDKTTEGEYSLINPKVRTLEKINLKVIVSYDESNNAYVECYADNIIRFDIDNAIALPTYTGGNLGVNVFNANINLNNIEIGESDYSYYTELYRNQYHFSQYARWNNDPNGLVYYDGYYHMYYQTHPFSNYWSDMYWGHARSKDLVHWQLLPICLFPDTEGEFGPGNGYMWSGSALVYRKGMSDLIDSYNWYPNGDGTGLIAYYTRHGGFQDQVIMSSDDGGLTWSKRVRIPQTICVGPGWNDCRDPELFPVKKEGDKVTMWGMILSGVNTQTCWFLKSTDMINWSLAGSFNFFYPECISIIDEEDKDGVMRQVIMFSSRYYIVGNINYNETSGEIEFIDLNNRSLSTYTATTLPLETMDYGPDSYASQAFSIDDPNSEYYGMDVSINWFSGVPNDSRSAESGMFAQARTNWNGGGMTIPVVLSLDNNNDLIQKPITLDNDAFNKTNIVNQNNVNYTKDDENILENVSTHVFEAKLDITNTNKSPIKFRLNIGQDEYTEVGWNEEDGYYVDRTHTSSAGIAFNNFGFDNYHKKYSSNIGKNDTNLDFYILSDNGGLEVFAKGYSVPFYVLTLASPYSVGAELIVEDDILINNLEVNEIASVYREDIVSDEGVLYMSSDDVYLDTTLTKEKEVSVYYTGIGDINYEIKEGNDIIEITSTTNGVKIKALDEGEAYIEVKAINKTKLIKVNVRTGTPNMDIDIDSSSIISGDWILCEDGLIGNATGDGFIISSTSGSDFVYSAKIDSSASTAAALVFRADKNLSNYLVANYDKDSGIAKLWSNKGVIAERAISVDVSSYVISVQAQGNNILVSINSNEVINVTLDDSYAKNGYYGLNVFNGKAIFNNISILSNSFVYEGGDFSFESPNEQAVLSIYNTTDKNTLIHKDFYYIEGNMITIKEDYFRILKEVGNYTFKINGSLSVFTINVDVKNIPATNYEDLIIEQGCNATIFIANLDVINVEVNGTILSNEQYEIKDYTLIISNEVFNIGNNIVRINNKIEISIDVLSTPTTDVNEENNTLNLLNVNNVWSLLLGTILSICSIAVIIFVIIRKRNKHYGG